MLCLLLRLENGHQILGTAFLVKSVKTTFVFVGDRVTGENESL